MSKRKPKPTYTPGPWRLEWVNVYDDHDGKPRPIADCLPRAGVRPLEECEENARLIAAAPDLLEACLAVFTNACGCNTGPRWPSGEHHPDCTIPVVWAAIAKAKGVDP